MVNILAGSEYTRSVAAVLQVAVVLSLIFLAIWLPRRAFKVIDRLVLLRVWPHSSLFCLVVRCVLIVVVGVAFGRIAFALARAVLDGA